MSQVCQNKNECSNLYKDKVVVLDTSALLNIIQAIVDIISCRDISTEETFAGFCEMLETFLLKICLCTYATRIQVSREVFDEEMNPTNNTSALRGLASFQEICQNRDTNYQEVNRLLRRNLSISPSAIPGDFIDRIRQTIRSLRRTHFTMPSRNDLGLLVLTLKHRSNRDGLLLTDDTYLKEGMETIQRNRYITLSRQIDTTTIAYASSLSYLNELYTCCRLLPPQFFAVYNVLFSFSHNPERPLPSAVMNSYEKLFSQIVRNISEIPKQPGEP